MSTDQNKYFSCQKYFHSGDVTSFMERYEMKHTDNHIKS